MDPQGRKILFYIMLMAGAMLLMLPAIINGYPLVNSDSSTYISSGFIPDAPWDRPITYGLLLYIFSLGGTSMWFAVFIQGYILAWLIALIVKKNEGVHRYFFTLLVIGLLSVLSSLSWVASELIADLYSGVIILCMGLLLCGGLTKTTRVLLYLLFWVAVATHTSHLVFCVTLLVLLLLFHRKVSPELPARTTRNALLIMLALTLSTLVVMSASMVKSKQMFMMGSLLDKGILKPALEELCLDSNYNLCKYKDVLPEDANIFMWDETGPLLREGGWKVTQPEYAHIINMTLSKPEYLWMYARASAVFTAKQLATFGIGDGNTPFPRESNVSATIREYVPHEHTAFLNSRQNSTGIVGLLTLPNAIIHLFVVLSIPVTSWLYYRNRHNMPYSFRVLLFVVISGIIINAWTCATFSMVIGRYAARVMWLLPLLAILAVRLRTKKPPDAGATKQVN